jgi:hypothetical protein
MQRYPTDTCRRRGGAIVRAGSTEAGIHSESDYLASIVWLSGYSGTALLGRKANINHRSTEHPTFGEISFDFENGGAFYSKLLLLFFCQDSILKSPISFVLIKICLTIFTTPSIQAKLS